jgi:hypothetical protein
MSLLSERGTEELGMTHLSVWGAGGGIEEAGTVVCVEEESMVVVDLNDED